MNRPSGFSRVVRDVVDLCELQLELLSLDGKVATKKAAMAGTLAAIGVVLALASLTTGTIALGYLIHEQLQWPLSGSLLAAAGLALLGSVIAALLGVVAIRRAVSALDESRNELVANVRWIKETLTSTNDSHPVSELEDRYPSRYAHTRSGQAY